VGKVKALEKHSLSELDDEAPLSKLLE